MTELLAPAGSINALKSAVYCGADAVYLGLENFNARIKADGFTTDNLSQWVRFCHLYGVKVFVTLNTNIKNEEVDLVAEYISVCNDALIDAFIVTDLGLLSSLQKYAPNIPLHASTQLGVHNLYAAKFVQQLGFSRVVLSREATLEDIKEIKLNTTLEVEYFVHGALCAGFSGGCLLSSITNGKSGNRGRCLQPCRLKYKNSLSKTEKYYLSASDQCLIEKLDDLKYVDSLKIEGRLKRSEYVAEVVTQYRKFIDKSERNINQSKQLLKTVYNRGDFTQGYNFDNTPEIMSIDVQGHKGVLIGKVTQCKRLDHTHEIKILLDRALEDGDGIKFIFEGEEYGGREASGLKAIGNEQYLAYNNCALPINTGVYLTTDSERNSYLAAITKKLPITLKFLAKEGEYGILKGQYGEICASVKTPQLLQKAQNIPTSSEELNIQLTKFGDSNFECNSCDFSLYANDLFVPKSVANGLRRQLISALEDAIIGSFRSCQKIEATQHSTRALTEFVSDKNKMLAQIQDISQLSAILCENCDLVLDFDDFSHDMVNSILINPVFHNNLTKLLIKLPVFADRNTLKYLDEIAPFLKQNNIAVVANNIYALEYAKTYGIAVFGGLGLNIYNNPQAKNLGFTKAFITSAELCNQELQKFTSESFYFAFGHMPLMTLLHCPVQLSTKCACVDCRYNGELFYQDKYATFIVRREKFDRCIFTLYNGHRHNLSSRTDKIKQRPFLNLFKCSKNDIIEIIEAFVDGKEYQKAENYTNGHMFRGVE